MKTKNKEITAKEKEEIIESNWKAKIEMEKRELKMYKKVLLKYAFVETCTASVYFHELFREYLLRGSEKIRDSNLTEKQHYKLLGELFGFGFNSSDNILEEEYKYIKRQVGWAKCNLNNLKHETKKKIIDDSISMQDNWSRQFDKTYKVIKKVQELEAKKMKRVKRGRTSSSTIKRR